MVFGTVLVQNQFENSSQPVPTQFQDSLQPLIGQYVTAYFAIGYKKGGI